MIEKLAHAFREILLVRAAAQAVKFAVVGDQPCGFAEAAQAEQKLATQRELDAIKLDRAKNPPARAPRTRKPGAAADDPSVALRCRAEAACHQLGCGLVDEGLTTDDIIELARRFTVHVPGSSTS